MTTLKKSKQIFKFSLKKRLMSFMAIVMMMTIVLQFFNYAPAFANNLLSKTVDITWNSMYQDSSNQNLYYYGQNKVSDFTVSANLSSGDTIDHFVVNMNPGTSYAATKNSQTDSSLGSVSGSTIYITEPFKGVPVKLTGNTLSDPYYDIWRNSAGNTWQATNEGVNYTFTPGSTGCWGDNTYNAPAGVSGCPGKLPSSLSSSVQVNGEAILTNKKISPPQKMATKSSFAIPNSYIDQSSYSISSISYYVNGGTPDSDIHGIDHGKGDNGYGYIKASKLLTKQYTQPGKDYKVITNPSSTGYAEGYRYYFKGPTTWTATTYSYTGTVTIYYSPPAQLDPAAVNITTSTSPILVNQPANFTLDVQNEGAADITNQSVGVTVKDDAGQTVYTGSFSNLASGSDFTANFTASFSTGGTHSLTLSLSPSFSQNTANDSITKSFTVASNISGDFTVNPSTINYHDSFTLSPTSFSIPTGCTYQYHEYKFNGNGSSVIAGKQTSETADSIFSSANYPSNLGVGSFTVTINIVTTCGQSGYISPHTLTVNGPTNDHPPVFSAGFFKENDYSSTSPIYQIVQGDYVNLRIIQNNNATPATPYDPDGDPFTFKWDFAGSSDPWIQAIGTKYGGDNTEWQYDNIPANTVGNHSVTVHATDIWGATTTHTVYIDIIPPNPVAKATCPVQWKENRPIPVGTINANQSYSPTGATINHSLDQWNNLKSSYVNGTLQNKTITVTLNSVTDSNGLTSLNSDNCSFTLTPDFPPVGKLNVPSRAYRGHAYTIYNNSYSPDHDTIASVSYRYKYDSNNNGFGDDPWQAVSAVDSRFTNITNSSFTFTPSMVGKYLFDVKAIENYGKSGYATDTKSLSSLTLDVLNQAPKVSFLLQGQNPIPFPSNMITYTASDILKNWALYTTSTNTKVTNHPYSWQNDNGTLKAGMGRNTEIQYPWTKQFRTNVSVGSFPGEDDGFGANHQSPYKQMTGSPSISGPILDPDSMTPMAFDRVWTNSKYIFIPKEDYCGNYCTPTYHIMAMNKNNLAKVQSYWKTTSDGYSFQSDLKWKWDHNPYDFDISNPSEKVTLSGGTMTYKYPEIAEGVSGETIYMIINATQPAATYYYRTNHHSYLQYNYGTNPKTTEVRTYDAFTGQLIAKKDYNFSVPTYGTYSYTNGDNFSVVNISSTSLEGWEFNRNGDLVQKNSSSWSDPKTPNYSSSYDYTTCNYSTDAALNQIWRGPDGELYFYGQYTCTEYDWGDEYARGTTPNTQLEPEQGTYLFRMNSDFTIAYKAKLHGYNSPYYYDNWGNGNSQTPLAQMDASATHIITRTYTNGSWGSQGPSYDIVNMDTGQVSPYGGTISRQTGCTTTIDGTCTQPNEVPSYGPKISGSQNNAGSNIEEMTGSSGISLYLGDGILLNYEHGTTYYNPTTTPWMWLTKGNVSSNQPVRKSAVLGQFESTNMRNNASYSFTMKLEHGHMDSHHTGFSFRMQNPMNRYAFETDGNTIFLIKYVNGSPTTLASTSFSFQDGVSNNVKISGVGHNLTVYMNDVPYLSASDSMYGSGTYGMFSKKPFVDFSNLVVKDEQVPQIDWSSTFAIYNQSTGIATVKYGSLAYSDPENDPKSGSYLWTVHHTPMYLNNQGLSSLDGRTFTSEQLNLDKIGKYTIDIQAKDDPNPNYRYPSLVFDNYRQLSNAFGQIIYVVRRPIAQFSLLQDPNTGTMIWNDTSYDPDRYDPSTGQYYTQYPTTGMDYHATKGIKARKFYYKTPSGVTVNAKLTTPKETGTYYVGEQVQDEYGAWSNWTEKSFTVNMVAKDTPPTAGFNVSPTSIYRGEAVKITSTASDAEDGGAANLATMYYVKNLSTGSGDTVLSTNRGTWTTSFSTLGTYIIRQHVCDSGGLCADASHSVTVKNRPPNAAFTWGPNPAWEGDTVHFTNTSTDPDNDPLTFSWTITAPDGARKSYTTKDFTKQFTQVGNYCMTLHVSDGYVSDTVSKQIQVRELAIQGMVQHTKLWEEHRISYNQSETGTNDKPRPYSWFFPGERFMLAATTGAHAEKVHVQLLGTDYDTRLTTSDGIHWSGYIWNKVMLHWKTQDLTFRFITYSKSSDWKRWKDVTVHIDDHPYWQQYRLW